MPFQLFGRPSQIICSTLHDLYIVEICAIGCVSNYFQVILEKYVKNCASPLKCRFLGIVMLTDSRVENKTSVTCSDANGPPSLPMAQLRHLGQWKWLWATLSGSGLAKLIKNAKVVGSPS
jgi:hypothetical protein